MASLSYQNASSSLPPRRKYEVFLSFRGEDTRKNFVSHLYKALDQKGIHTFKDDQKLERGKAISPELLKAIEDSRFSIIIFSENYASSTWCLEELVKILECMDTMGQIVLPVFYEVDPSHVSKQKERFAEFFAKHEEDFKAEMEKVDRWRSALTRAANLSGWDSRDSDESMLIEEIVRRIFEKLMHLPSSEGKGLVGMTSRLNDMNSLLRIGLDDVRIIGIWGMAGIGKTTIAKAIYEQISDQFEGCCFLANVKEGWKRGPSHLLGELLSKILKQKYPYDEGDFNVMEERLRYKKVLIVLDDVDKLDQLTTLAGDRSWFGPESRIIITTTDKQLLITHGVTKIYEAQLLDDDQSLQLFLKHAFKQNQPKQDFMDLSKRVVKYAQGLPLALQVLGSFLFRRSIDKWEDSLKKLKRIPDTNIHRLLEISFDGLDDTQKDIFLDIACFFRGKDRDYVVKLLDSCGFFPCIGMDVLVERALITIFDNKLQMHDLLQEMGWEIVRRESVKEPGERSRLWICQEVCDVLMQNTATRAVEGIILDLFHSEEVHLNTEAFARMNRLRLLKVYYSHLSRDFESSSEEVLCRRTTAYGRTNDLQPPELCKLHLSGDFKFLSHELRCLCWHQYPLKSLPSNFHPKNLVELDMRYSHVQQLWKGVKPLYKLEFIDLSHSQYLTETPDFTGVPNLKRLILEGCKRLFEVHPSIGYLDNLIFLNLKDCTRLRSLPRSIYLKSLKTLTLSGCSRLKTFPEISGNMENLSELRLDGTAIEELSSSINRLTGLVLLNLKDCRRLTSLPNSICQLKSLEILILSGCSKLDKLPENLGNIKSLAELNVDGTALNQLPSSIVNLNNLGLLSARGCKNTLSQGLVLPAFSGLCSLRRLDLSDCNIFEIPTGIGCLSSLAVLNLSSNNFRSLPESIKQLSQLHQLNLEYCRRLQSVPELPASVYFIDAHDCESLEAVSSKGTGADCCISLGGPGFLNFIFTNCFKLVSSHVSNIMAVAIQKNPDCADSYSMFQPGCEIPMWFSHQRMGSSITIQLPPDWRTSKFKGFAVCAVYTFGDANCEPSFCARCNYTFKNTYEEENFYFNFGGWEEDDGGRFIGSDHLFLGFAPLTDDMFRGKDKVNDKGEECGYTEASFEFCASKGYDDDLIPCRIKSCGVRLVYIPDEGENNPTMIEPSHCESFEPSHCESFSVIHQDFGHRLINVGTKTKKRPRWLQLPRGSCQWKWAALTRRKRKRSPKD